jgi:hypothetical protein
MVRHVKKRASLHGARCLPGRGGASPLQDPRLKVLGTGRLYLGKRDGKLQAARSTWRDAGILHADSLILTLHPDGFLIVSRADGKPLGSEILRDQAFEADRQHLQEAFTRRLMWNEAERVEARSPGAGRALLDELARQGQLRVPSGRGFSPWHQAKSEQARERRETKLVQGEELPAEPHPRRGLKQPGRRRKPSRIPAIAPLPPA